jgi:hypothetical protein
MLRFVAAARHHEIRIPRAAFGTAQQPHPAIVDGGRDRLGGGGPSKAGNGRPHLSRERHLPSQPLSPRHHEDAAQLYLRSGVTISAATATIK